MPGQPQHYQYQAPGPGRGERRPHARCARQRPAQTVPLRPEYRGRPGAAIIWPPRPLPRTRAR